MTLDAHATFGEGAHGKRQQLVLLLADARVQRRDIVILAHLDTTLHQDRPAVHFVSDEMDGAARHFDAVLDGLGHGMHRAAERGQQRRMRVQDAAAVGGHELGAEDFIKASQHDQLDAGCPQGFEELPLAVGTARGGHAVRHAHRDGRPFGAADRRRFGVIAGHQHHAYGKVWLARSIEQRLKVRAGARDENANPQRRNTTRSAWRGTTRPTSIALGHSGRGSSPAPATKISPRPMLKTRSISSSEMPPRSCRTAKIGGTGQAPQLSSTETLSGRTRGRLPGMPPPVMWAMAFSSGSSFASGG